MLITDHALVDRSILTYANKETSTHKLAGERYIHTHT